MDLVLEQLSADKLSPSLGFQKTLPQLKEAVRRKQDSTRLALGKLGVGLPETEEGKVTRLMQVGWVDNA